MKEDKLLARITLLEDVVKKLSSKLEGETENQVDYSILNETDVFYLSGEVIGKYLAKGDVLGLIRGEVQLPLYDIRYNTFSPNNGWTFGGKGVENKLTELKKANEKEIELYYKEEMKYNIKNYIKDSKPNTVFELKWENPWSLPQEWLVDGIRLEGDRVFFENSYNKSTGKLTIKPNEYLGVEDITFFALALRPEVEIFRKYIKKDKPPIKLHNDGKGKWQSFEAYLRVFENVPVEGYGATKEEAIDNLKEEFNKYIEDLKKESDKIDYESYVEVDWKGEEIKK